MLQHKKNDIVKFKITDLGINGEGVGKLDAPIFVPFALKYELVKAKIVKLEKNFYYGKLEEIIEKSEYRITPPCEVFGKCGGCQLQHLTYDEQLNFKTQLVKNTLQKVGNITAEVIPTVKSEKEYGYRNKISLPFREINSENKIGFFMPRSHEIIKIETCPLHSALLNTIIPIVKEFTKKYNISYYNDETTNGLMRHLVAREYHNNVLVALVINGSKLPYANELFIELKKQVQNVSLYVNYNTIHNNVILGKTSELIGGKLLLEEELYNIKVHTSIESFMQVNDDIRNKMYNEALTKIRVFSPNVVIDAYSGAGLLSGIIAKNTNTNVIGLEIVKEAVEASNKMLKENALESKVTNILGDCEITLPEVVKAQKRKVSLIVDPPRAGISKNIIKAILSAKPEQIIYIACGLTTLSRDLAYLLNKKNIETDEIIKEPVSTYEIISVTPYDMFPQTKHVETLVELKLKS